VDKDGNEVTRSGGVMTPEGISSQDVTFTSPGSFNVRVEKIKDTNEMVQSGLTVVPEFQVGITSIVVTRAIAAIIITAKRMSFLQMSKMY
jgi:type II secretory pathway component PulM